MDYIIRYVMRDDDGDKAVLTKTTTDPNTAIAYALSKATRPRIKGEKWTATVEIDNDSDRAVITIDSVPSKADN